jgi:hypothetical protein
MVDTLNIAGLILNIIGVVMLFKKEKPKLIDGGVDTVGNLNRKGEIRYNRTALYFIVAGFVFQVVANVCNYLID